MAKKRKRNLTSDYDERRPEYASIKDYTEPPADLKGAHLYSSEDALPWDLQTHWKHRQSMFSMYDNGIWTTDDSWFEVTHECIARKIAQHTEAAKSDGKLIVLDCFAGIGGNAIAFALSGYKRVYAIEKNLAAIKCAEHNAILYGVRDKITFWHGDCFELLGLDDGKSGKASPELVALIQKAGIIFGSPPWGGPSYKENNVMDLNQMPYTLDYMYSAFSKITKEIILYLPRTSDLNQLADCVEAGDKAQIVHYCIHENSKALCVYFGNWKEIQT